MSYCCLYGPGPSDSNKKDFTNNEKLFITSLHCIYGV
jgi:hypothetical protein